TGNGAVRLRGGDAAAVRGRGCCLEVAGFKGAGRAEVARLDGHVDRTEAGRIARAADAGQVERGAVNRARDGGRVEAEDAHALLVQVGITNEEHDVVGDELAAHAGAFDRLTDIAVFGAVRGQRDRGGNANGHREGAGGGSAMHVGGGGVHRRDADG